MIIAHNMMAQFSGRQLNINTKSKSKSAERLSSGYKINRASDDAAGLSISEKMRGQIRGLERASDNCQDAVSFCQVADGAMSEMNAIMNRMRTLCVQASNDTYTDDDRMAIQLEVEGLVNEIERITEDTEYNQIKVFGREREKTVTSGAPGSTGVTQLLNQIYEVKGNNYGLAEVIGENSLSSSNKLNQVMNYSGSGWNTTGMEGYSYKGSNKTATEMEAILKGFNSKLSIDYTTLRTNSAQDPSLGTWNGNCFIYDNGTGTEINLYFSGDNKMLSSGSEYEYTVDQTTGERSNRRYVGSLLGYAGRVGGSGVLGNKYGSAWIDFSGAGVDYKIEDLYNEGFSTTCATCSKYYSIKFTNSGSTTNTDGVSYNYVDSSSFPQLEIDISNCTNGEDIVRNIMSAVKRCNQFNNHYTQYAYNDSEKAKLYIYDNRTSQIKGGSSTFDPTYRRSDGSAGINEYKVITNPTTGHVTTYQDKELWIQMGANSKQGIYLGKPWLNTNILGIGGVDIGTQESADNSILICDKAIQKLNDERSKIGAFQNRFEYAILVADNTAENLQSAESRIRDADMADEMVEYSRSNILEQAAQSMLAQANQSQQGILQLLQ